MVSFKVLNSKLDGFQLSSQQGSTFQLFLRNSERDLKKVDAKKYRFFRTGIVLPRGLERSRLKLQEKNPIWLDKASFSLWDLKEDKEIVLKIVNEAEDKPIFIFPLNRLTTLSICP